MATQAVQQPTSSKDRWVKRLFIATALVVVVAVYLLQRGGGQGLPAWPSDLEVVLTQAKAQNRPVLVFFHFSPPGETAQRLGGTTLAKNAPAIAKGGFLTARVPVSSLGSELAKRYRLKELPTLVLLDPSGKETNRRTGFVGEVPFRDGFLDRAEVQPPPAD